MTDGVEGLTVLHVAAHNGAYPVVKALVEHGADVNHNHVNQHKYAPLHWAAQKGHTQVVIYLLLHGANPDIEAVDGLRPIHLAGKWNRPEVVRALCLAFGEVDAVHTLQGNRYTALHHAAAKGSISAAKWLLRFGGNPDVQLGGGSPVQMAKFEKQPRFIETVEAERRTALG